MGKSPKVKGLALNSTQADYVDADYCLKRNIAISVVLNPSVVAVAEFAVLLLLGSSRRIFVNGWKSQKRMYQWELGSELAGKTMGIVGIDAVAERIIRIVKPFGVRIFICNEPPTRVEEAERKSPGEILCYSDLIILNLVKY